MQLPAWIVWLDRRIGSWGIEHIIRIVVALNAATFVLDLFNPGFVSSLLLDTDKILGHGEWWRMVTFLFATSSTSNPVFILFFVMGLMCLWTMGEGLEAEWGALALNLYMVIPWVLLVAVAFSPWAAFVSNWYLGAGLLLAFATLYPDFEVTLIPIPIPIKVKWIAIVLAGFAVLTFISKPYSRLEILAGLSSYFLFFGFHWYSEIKLRMESRARMKKFRGDQDG